MFKLLKVSGESLVPLVEDGDYILVSSIPIYLRCLKKGDLVVFTQIPFGIMVKQVIYVGRDHQSYLVEGTNRLSVDSRHFGPVLRNALIGKVIYRFKKSK